MRNLCRILLSLVLAGLSAEAVCAQNPVLPVASDGALITVTAPNGCITDASGTPMASGSIMIQGVNAASTAIPFGYGTGQAVTTPVTRTITAGSLVGSLQLVNPALSAPSQILYHITIVDNSTLKTSNYVSVPLYLNDVPVSGRNTVFNFCLMNTGLAVPSVPTTIVQGPPGQTGQTGPVGPAGMVNTEGSTGSFAVNGGAGILYAKQAAVSNASLTGLRAALHSATSTPVNIGVIGDSILCCIGPTNIANNSVSQLRTLLSSAYGYGGTGVIPIGDNGGLATRPEWTLSGTWTTVNDFGPYQTGVGAFGSTFTTTGSGSASLAAESGDTLYVYGEAAPGDSGWDVSIDGTFRATIGAYVSGPASVYRIGLTPVALGAHTASVTPHGGGTAHIYGMEWTAGTGGVRLHNFAHGYARTDAFATSSTQLAYVQLANISAAIDGLGVNDSIAGTGTTLAQYTANQTAILSALQGFNANMSLLIVDEPDVQSPGTTLTQAAIRGAEQSLATSFGAAYTSWANAWTSYAVGAANGLNAGDGIHPSDKGGREMGAILFDVLTDHATLSSGTNGTIAPFLPGYRDGGTGGAYTMQNADALLAFAGTTITVPTALQVGETHFVFNYGGGNVTFVGMTAGSTANVTLAPGCGITMFAGGAGYWHLLSSTCIPPPAPAQTVVLHAGADVTASRTLLNTDALVYVTTAGSVVTFPASPVKGQQHILINVSGGSITTAGSAGTQANITIPNGKAATFNYYGSGYWWLTGLTQ